MVVWGLLDCLDPAPRSERSTGPELGPGADCGRLESSDEQSLAGLDADH